MGFQVDTDRDDHLTLTSEALNVSDDEWDQVCSLSRYLVQPAACTADIETAGIAPPYVPPCAWVGDPPRQNHGVWRGDCKIFGR